MSGPILSDADKAALVLVARTTAFHADTWIGITSSEIADRLLAYGLVVANKWDLAPHAIYRTTPRGDEYVRDRKLLEQTDGE